MKRTYKQQFNSAEFEKKTGIKGLSVEWVMPDQLTPDQFAAKLLEWSHNEDPKKEEALMLEMTRLYLVLCRNNREIEKIQIETLAQMFDVCYGALSKFNADDIRFYVMQQKQDLMMYNLNSRNRKQRIEQVASMDMQWVACPDTLFKIEKALGITT